MSGHIFKNELEQCLGNDKMFTEQFYREKYSTDATGIKSLPDVVVFPENDGDLQNILKIAYRHKVPVTPRGAGEGYSGGAVPLQGGILLSFDRMNNILSIDMENFYATVEPGVITHDLQQAVEAKGLCYPPDPASLKTCSIGGNVAENAGGPRCFKYGVTQNYVLGLEGFLVTGEPFHAGSPVLKDVAGYDLKSLLVGSEGTLAVISKILLRLIPKPPCQQLFRVDFKSLKVGAAFLNRMIRENIGPSALEFIDKSSLDAAYSHLGLSLKPGINAAVLIELDGSETDIDERKKRFLELVEENKRDVVECITAKTEEEQDQLWLIRREISPAIKKLKPKKINEDIVVPSGKIPDTVDYINGLSEEYGIMIPMFGHFGDGNIHTNLMVDPSDEEEMKRAEIILDKILRYVISVKGTITGEHGVGISKKPFMKYQFTDVEMTLFKNIKKAFDPENLLNPGKIF
ncbi:MAG: FAD-binding protein [bacterium]|nr:FAD-binding protein [bacterium]